MWQNSMEKTDAFGKIMDFSSNTLNQEDFARNVDENSSYFGYIYGNESVSIGPVLVAVSQQKFDKTVLFNMSFQLIREETISNMNIGEKQNIEEIKSQLDSVLKSIKILPDFETVKFQKYISNSLQNGQLKFQVVRLPSDKMHSSPKIHRKDMKMDSSSQTPTLGDGQNAELFEFLKQEILLLKEQNRMLKDQVEHISRKNSVQSTKAYVIRKQSQDTASIDRNDSASTLDVPLNSYVSKSTFKSTHENSNHDQRNDSMHEILQEYMVENEELRKQNLALSETRAKQKSELDSYTKQNKELSKRINELTTFVKNLKLPDEHSSENSRLTRRQDNAYTNYPILSEDQLESVQKNSYLKQYDIAKYKLLNKHAKNVPTTAREPQLMENANSSSKKLRNDKLKHFSEQEVYNDALREELERIDNTIKEHIRKTQLNDTLRYMGAHK